MFAQSRTIQVSALFAEQVALPHAAHMGSCVACRLSWTVCLSRGIFNDILTEVVEAPTALLRKIPRITVGPVLARLAGLHAERPEGCTYPLAAANL